MAAVTHRVATASTSNVTSYASGAFTPANGELLVALVAASGTQAAGALTDSLGGTWTRITESDKNTNVDRLYAFVRDALIGTGASMTVTFTCTEDAATGAIIFVAGVSGMSRSGSAAVRQSGVAENQGAGVTPTFTLAAAALTDNPTIAFMGNSVNPAAVTPPTGWTEQADTGYSTPSKGAEYATRDSGFTGTTVTWGAATSTVWSSIGFELDTSADEVTGTGTFPLALGMSGTAVAPIAAAGTFPLGLGMSGTGVAPIAAAGALPLSIGMSGTGTVADPTISGTGTFPLALGLTGTAAAPIAGAGSFALQLGLTGAAVAPIAGAGSFALQLGLTGAAVAPIAGAGSFALQLGLTGAAVAPIAGTGAFTFALGLEGTGEVTGVGSGIAAEGAFALALGMAGQGHVPAPEPVMVWAFVAGRYRGRRLG